MPSSSNNLFSIFFDKRREGRSNKLKFLAVLIFTVLILTLKLHKTGKKKVGGYIAYGGSERMGFLEKNKKKLMKFLHGTTAPMTTTPDIEGILDNDDGKRDLTGSNAFDLAAQEVPDTVIDLASLRNDDPEVPQENSESTDGAASPAHSNEVGTLDGLSESSSLSSSLSSPQNSPIDPYAKLAPHEKQLREREDAFYFAGLHMNGGDEGGAKNQLGAAVDAIDEYESSIDSMSNLDKMAFLLNSKVGGLSVTSTIRPQTEHVTEKVDYSKLSQQQLENRLMGELNEDDKAYIKKVLGAPGMGDDTVKDPGLSIQEREARDHPERQFKRTFGIEPFAVNDQMRLLEVQRQRYLDDQAGKLEQMKAQAATMRAQLMANSQAGLAPPAGTQMQAGVQPGFLPAQAPRL